MRGGTLRRLDLPSAAWLVPMGTAVAAIVVWAAWCDSPTAAWVGAALVVATGLLVFSLVMEGLAPIGGAGDFLRRTAIASGLALLTGALTAFVAGLGLYLHCPFFDP